MEMVFLFQPARLPELLCQPASGQGLRRSELEKVIACARAVGAIPQLRRRETLNAARHVASLNPNERRSPPKTDALFSKRCARLAGGVRRLAQRPSRVLVPRVLESVESCSACYRVGDSSAANDRCRGRADIQFVAGSWYIRREDCGRWPREHQVVALPGKAQCGGVVRIVKPLICSELGSIPSFHASP